MIYFIDLVKIQATCIELCEPPDKYDILHNICGNSPIKYQLHLFFTRFRLIFG